VVGQLGELHAVVAALCQTLTHVGARNPEVSRDA